MANRYPKMASPGPADYQKPKPARPRPANDNRPRVMPPRPANDNIPGRAPRPGAYIPPTPFGKRYYKLLKVARPVGRIVPALNFLLLMWDLYDLYQSLQRFANKDYRFCQERRPNRGIVYGWGPGLCLSASPAPTGPYSSGARWWHRMCQETNPARYYTIERWLFPTNPGTTPVELPPIGVPLPEILPDYVPWLPPLFYPPGAPTPFPLAPPIRLPEAPNPWPRPDDDPASRGRPVPRPIEWPDKGYGPDQRVKPEPRLNPRPRRPRKNERERKVEGTSKMRKWLGKALSGASEAGDILEALHDALPKEVQAKGGLKEKFDALWQNLDKVNMDQAVVNLWKNHVSDKYYGQAFGEMQEAFEGAGLELPDLKGLQGSSGLW